MYVLVGYEVFFLTLEELRKILYPKLVCFGYHFLENLPDPSKRNKKADERTTQISEKLKNKLIELKKKRKVV